MSSLNLKILKDNLVELQQSVEWLERSQRLCENIQFQNALTLEDFDKLEANILHEFT